MKQWQVLRTIFPAFITENFEFVDYKECDNRLDYWLDERGYMSREDYKKGTVRVWLYRRTRHTGFSPTGQSGLPACEAQKMA